MIRRRSPLLGVTIRAASTDCTENGARRARVTRVRGVRYRSRAARQVAATIGSQSTGAHPSVQSPTLSVDRVAAAPPSEVAQIGRRDAREHPSNHPCRLASMSRRRRIATGNSLRLSRQSLHGSGDLGFGDATKRSRPRGIALARCTNTSAKDNKSKCERGRIVSLRNEGLEDPGDGGLLSSRSHDTATDGSRAARLSRRGGLSCEGHADHDRCPAVEA